MKFYYTEMNEILRLFLLLYAGLFAESDIVGDSKPFHSKYVVCYLDSLSFYRPGRGSFKINDVNGYLCTHLVYAFLGLNHKTFAVVSLDPFNNIMKYNEGPFSQMRGLRKKYPHLKMILSVGGWTEDFYYYSTMALKSSSRREFIKSAKECVTKHSFDGVDIAWKYPRFRGRHEDKQNFIFLLKELKEELSKSNLILTASLGASRWIINNSYRISEITKYADILIFMCYDYFSSPHKTLGFYSPIRSDDGLNIKSTIKYVINLGAPREKIVIGIPAYGQHYHVNSTTKPGLSSPYLQPGARGPFTQRKGFLSYYEICREFSRNKNSSRFWDEEALSTFSIKGRDIASYDDETSIHRKVHLALEYNIRGFAFLTIDADDFRGDCNKTKADDPKEAKTHSYPLLKEIHRTIIEYEKRHQKSKRSCASPILPLSVLTVISIILPQGVYLFQ